MRAARTPSPRRGEGWGEGARRFRMRGVSLTQPSPRWGEGFSSRGHLASVRSVKAEQQFLADALDHCVGVVQHVVVPEADDAVAEALERARALRVDLRAMLATVDLDDEVRGAAGEVGDVRSDRELEDELGAFELARAEVVPEALFCVGALAPEFAGNGGEALFRQRRSPSPPPSPRRGEGVKSRHARPDLTPGCTKVLPNYNNRASRAPSPRRGDDWGEGPPAGEIHA